MSGILDHADLVVERRPQLFERRTAYDVYDGHRTTVGSVEQVGRDNLEKLVRPQRSDNARTPLELSDASGPVLLMTHVQAFKSSLEVARPDGTGIGRLQLENLFGKSRFGIEVAGAGTGIAAAQSWRKRSFVVADGQGAEVARIEMTQGKSGDHSHDNHYTLQIDPGFDDTWRALAFAALIAVDTILWTRHE